MAEFSEICWCKTCGREYVISGNSLGPGDETRVDMTFPCACGALADGLVPASANQDEVRVTPKGMKPRQFPASPHELKRKTLVLCDPGPLFLDDLVETLLQDGQPSHRFWMITQDLMRVGKGLPSGTQTKEVEE